MAAKKTGRTAKAPVYMPMVQALRDAIESGELRHGSYLASEHILGKSYRISRVSVRSGLKQLRDRGLVEAIAGKGYRVTGSPNLLREVVILVPSAALMSVHQGPFFLQLREHVEMQFVRRGIPAKTVMYRHVPSGTVDWGAHEFGLMTGVVVLGASQAGDLPARSLIKGPVMQVGCRLDGWADDSFQLDDVHAGVSVTQHLLENGHERMVLLTTSGPRSGLSWFERGVREQMAVVGKTLDSRLTVQCQRHEDAGYQELCRLIRTGHSFTAVIASHRELAIGAARACGELRTKEPVVVVSGAGMEAGAAPSVCGMASDVPELGRAVVQRLLARVDDQDLPPEARFVQGTFVTDDF